MATYDGDLTDEVVTGVDSPVTYSDRGLVETIRVASPVTALNSLLIAESLRLLDMQPEIQFQAGAAIVEIIKLLGSPQTQTTYSLVQMQIAKLSELLQLAHDVGSADGIIVQDVLSLIQLATILDRLKVKDLPLPATTYNLALVQALALHDSLAKFLGAGLSDNLGLMETVTIQFQMVVGLAQGFTIADVLGQSLLFSLVVQDDVDLDDAQLLNMIYAGDPLLDMIRLSAAYVDPGGGVTTWAINTRTGAVTEYWNYVFNSIARMGNRYLGADSTGLWLLDGPLDDTSDIPTYVRSGWMQLSGSKFTSFKAAYLGLRVRDNARDFFLKLRSGDGREYVYAVVPNNMATTRVNMGKGLRARYFSFELITTGADYDLDSIEFLPITSNRRI